MIEEIKTLYQQVKNKTNFFLVVAEDLNRSPKTMRVHWFSNCGFWSIPKEHQKRVIEILKETIKTQDDGSIITKTKDTKV